MSHLDHLGTYFTIPIPRDEEGFVGRECPVADCEGFFKVAPGTGLAGENLPCHCPYCGHKDDSSSFFTKAQNEYAQSVVIRKVTDAIFKDFKAIEFKQQPTGTFGLGFSMKVSGQPTPIHRYREPKLETEVVCDSCTLRYTIYGAFGFCPDCATHNSLQILNNNFVLVQKLLAIAETQEPQLANYLVENALEDCVSAFDGFGRETCRVFSRKAVTPDKATDIRFQNIKTARNKVQDQFSLDFAATTTSADWNEISRAFQKRHLLAHKMGVIDDNYLSATGESSALLGRKVSIAASEVLDLVERLRSLGAELFRSLETK